MSTNRSGRHTSIATRAPDPARLARHARQGGVFGILFALLVLVMLGFCALALDIGQVYNRKVDLNGFAKAVALAAARELNGTPAGIVSATAQARATAERLKYEYFGGGRSFAWNDNALAFGATSSRSGNWIPAATAGASAATLYFAKVDTADLDDDSGSVQTFFIQALAPGSNQVSINDSAIAGRAAVNVTPLAVCAMGDAATARTAPGSAGTPKELVQYGFRRGVSYDLMQLNPNGTDPASYGVNPVSAPGATSNAFDPGILPAFMCTGSMWVPRLTGGAIHVARLPSANPLAALDVPLNSRFDVFSGGTCDPSGAPPDYNVKSYAYDVAGAVKWMTPNTGSASALKTTAGGRLATVADLATLPTSKGDYGPLWTYARAVKAPSPVTAPEPNGGYATFGTSDWPAIYGSGPAASGYPSSSPYLSSSAASGNYQAPSAANLDRSSLQRRVLNLPLLDCTSGTPAGSNTQATVLAIGKFFMTVPATRTALIAEFAGIVPQQAVSGQMGVYP